MLAGLHLMSAGLHTLNSQMAWVIRVTQPAEHIAVQSRTILQVDICIMFEGW